MILFLLLSILQKEVTPPGTVKVGELFVDQTEILNIHWLEYEYYAKKNLEVSEYYLVQPKKENTWYDKREFRNRPMTHITYQQAIDYCKWRSAVVSESLNREIVYRLPTPEEWDLIANVILEENQKRVFEYLEELSLKLAKKENQYYLTDRSPKKGKIIDLFSSVSEMTSIEGTAKGGNNLILLDSSRLKTNIEYDRPHPYLGFRCIAEVKDKIESRKR